MRECSCSQSRGNTYWPYSFPKVETKLGIAQILVDEKTITKTAAGMLGVVGADNALPGQIARLSEDGTAIEWYTPDHIQADGRTIVKDSIGNISIAGVDIASIGQVLQIADDGSVKWCDQLISSVDNQTLSVAENGTLSISGSDSASNGQFLQIQEDGSVAWVALDFDERINTINETLRGNDGQLLSYADGSPAWVDAPSLQTDWNETDESSVSFMRNKPQITSNDDALDVLCEYGYVNPIASGPTSLFVDNSGKIFEL